MNDIRMKYYKLGKDTKFTGREVEDESCFVLLSGTCQIWLPDENVIWSKIGKRNNVFQGNASVVYIPLNTRYEILALSDNLEAIQILTKAERKLSPFLLEEKEIKYEQRGRGVYRRKVCNLLDNRHVTDRLIVGETIHQGTWSGYPPHKHDLDNYPFELKEEEIYFIKVDPPSAFGMFVNYDNVIENGKVTLLTNNSFINVNSGFHCVVSSPECNFYYLWALAHDKKEVVFSIDSEFAGEVE